MPNEEITGRDTPVTPNTSLSPAQKMCRKCGNCCQQGGPALHSQDLELIRNGKLVMSSLITIRKGELAHNPLSGKIQPVKVELVKIIGTGRQWACCYHDTQNGCTIYENRPHACRVLKCWETEQILELVEKDTLTRLDIIGEGDPLAPVIKEHQRICPCDDLQLIRANLHQLSGEQKNELEKRVRSDLRFRARVIDDFHLKLSEELFYFGRPFFQLLQAFGVKVFEAKGELHIKWGN